MVVSKMKDKTTGVAIEEFAGLQPKMHSYLVNYDSKHKYAKGINKNIVVTRYHNDINFNSVE